MHLKNANMILILDKLIWLIRYRHDLILAFSDEFLSVQLDGKYKALVHDEFATKLRWYYFSANESLLTVAYVNGITILLKHFGICALFSTAITF